MAERSMPEQDGIHYATAAEKAEERRARNALIEAMVAAIHGREPVRVIAEVGRPVPEIESS